MPAARYPFAGQSRLLCAADFKRVFDRAERSTDRYFTVLARRNTLDCPRLGLAVSRKNAKRAVDRNRIKRHIRESFRIRALPGLDFVVMNRRDAATATNRQISQSLNAHWEKLVSLCAKSSSH